MKLSLLLICVLACLALLAFDEGEAAYGKRNPSLHRLRSLRRKKSRGSRNLVKTSRRKSARRKTAKRSLSSRRKSKLKFKEIGKKISSTESAKIARLTQKLVTLERKLNSNPGCTACNDGPPGKNITERDLCTAPFVASYEGTDLTRFACCEPPQELRNGACVDPYCHIRTTVYHIADEPDDRFVRVSAFEIINGTDGEFRMDGIEDIEVSGQDDLMMKVDSEGVFFACTSEDCCQFVDRNFQGTLTYTQAGPTGGCNIFIDMECSFSEELNDLVDCPCGGSFQFEDQFQDVSYRFTRGALSS